MGSEMNKYFESSLWRRIHSPNWKHHMLLEHSLLAGSNVGNKAHVLPQLSVSNKSHSSSYKIQSCIVFHNQSDFFFFSIDSVLRSHHTDKVQVMYMLPKLYGNIYIWV